VKQRSFEDYVIRIINSQVLQPAGLSLDPDTLNGKTIRANTITSTEIQARTITSEEIRTGTITANELTSNIVLVNNIIRSNNYVGSVSGWSIFSNGNAEFNNVKIRGDILSGAGVYAASNTPLFANAAGFFSLGNKITWDGSNLVINGTVTLSGTNIGTFDNGDALTGGSIGGLSITSTYIGSTDFDGTGQGFRIYSNGVADFNEVSVRGEIIALSGSIADNFIIGNNIIIGNSAAIGNNAIIGNDVIIGDRLEIGGNLVIGEVVRINNPTPDSTVTTLKVSGSVKNNAVNASNTYPFRCQSAADGVGSRNVFHIANNGDLWHRGSYSSGSDMKLKRNVEDLNLGIDFIKTLRPVSYSLKTNTVDDSRLYGFIAQEVETAVSEFDQKSTIFSIVDRDDESIYSLSYTQFIAPAIKSIQELSEKIEFLEARLQTLEDV
jgi:hypothetical protein